MVSNTIEMKRSKLIYTAKKDYAFSIKDNGIGIDPQYHSDVFTMFKRLHTKSEYKGTGMGLATVKKRVNKLNWSIALKSDIGNGSEFIITIPKLTD